MSAQTSTPVFHATTRTQLGRKTKQLRREGKLPAVLYGNVKENRHLSLDAHTFNKLFSHIGYTTLVDLIVDDEKPIKVLVQDAAHNPVKEGLQHVDFYAVNLKEKLTTEVPLQYTGVADAVEILGGIFLTVKDNVEIECLPEDLPQHIEVDITSLKTFDDSIRIKDLIVPKGVEIIGDPEDVLASVSEPISEAELAALEEAPTETPETEFATGGEATEGEGENAEGEKENTSTEK
jgi:large subunit ribosomal protein L25